MNIPIDKFEDWLRNKDLKERTIEEYLYYFNKFNIYDFFNQETVSKFLSHKSNRNSVSRGFLKNFRRFLIVNYQELGLSEEALKNVLRVELPHLTGRKKLRLINPLSKEQIIMLENSLGNEKLKLQLLLSYYCGLRLGELFKLTIMSFNWDKWKEDKTQMGECRVYGKGDKEGIALVPPFLMKRVAKYIKENNFFSISNYLFLRNDRPTKYENIARSWQLKLKQAGIKVGITKFDENNKPIPNTVVHPHRLRHSYASYLLNDLDLDIREVQELLRHSSIQSTQIYTHINKDRLKAKLLQKERKNKLNNNYSLSSSFNFLSKSSSES